MEQEGKGPFIRWEGQLKGALFKGPLAFLIARNPALPEDTIRVLPPDSQHTLLYSLSFDEAKRTGHRVGEAQERHGF